MSADDDVSAADLELKIQDAQRPRRTYLSGALFRKNCQFCGEQFAVGAAGNLVSHVDHRSKPVLALGQLRRARCAGSGKPPA